MLPAAPHRNKAAQPLNGFHRFPFNQRNRKWLHRNVTLLDAAAIG
jgi:hypothetical protein